MVRDLIGYDLKYRKSENILAKYMKELVDQLRKAPIPEP